jgi:N-methylhydantoinase A/oxoprolinase/acetone carboxylase beta subunit
MTSTSRQPLYLGIDTGGTYTDAVLWSPGGGIAAKAKALTTRHDLAEGISEAADRVIEAAGISPESIGIASMSTTLATNALVEGHGGRTALVMIGFAPGDIVRAGLAQALGTDPVVSCPGGHDVHGNAEALDLSPLANALGELEKTVTAFAVCAMFAVRNPAHEIAARDLIRERTGLPVTCSHELTSKLGGPRRALTTLLNARLIPTIDRLVAATMRFMDARGIDAPLMVVRGDGSLMVSAMASERPIETILSGPAASVVGARHLTGLKNAVVSDIGGTTTDIAILDDGMPRIDPEGAIVGGYRTMVEAVAMHTYGLGGDSEVSLEEGGLNAKILLGPRRLVPLALCGKRFGEPIYAVLERQLRSGFTGRYDGRFAFRTGIPDRHATGLGAPEEKLFASMTSQPQALDNLLQTRAQAAILQRLVSRGLVHVAGFTPSDAAHVLGLQENWDAKAAVLGALLFARNKDGRGKAIAPNAETLSEQVLKMLTRRSAETILQTVFAEDSLEGSTVVHHPLVQNALDGKEAIGRIRIELDRPVIGLGASASLHYRDLGPLVGNDVAISEHAGVANALGAVAGNVQIKRDAYVSMPQPGIFRVTVGESIANYPDEEQALAAAENELRLLVARLVSEAGGEKPALRLSRDVKAATIEGERTFVEAYVTAVSTGRPRIASR